MDIDRAKSIDRADHEGDRTNRTEYLPGEVCGRAAWPLRHPAPCATQARPRRALTLTTRAAEQS
eukprot:1599739-Alexandrium_andersonii.AAC.1